MNKKFLAGTTAAVFTLALAAKDPVIMTINGVDVPKSEFEYLYNKNSKQQLNPMPLEEYVEMFKLYKLKAADARAEGLDTIAAFRKEMEQHKHDLAAPYLADSVYLNKLFDETYDRMQREVEARHIMLFKTRDAAENVELRERADSLLKVLRNGGNFEELASQYSQDRGSVNKGGYMGWIVASRLPYNFESAAFSLSEGEISDVVETPQGYHILKGGKSRPARGKVQVSHILKMTRNLDEKGQAAAKATIDSIYEIVKNNPDKFAELATAKSDDRQSARQGGALPWFGAGEMVAAFDSVAFAIADNEISQPFKSDFGWHIIKKTGSRPPVLSKAEMKPGFMARMENPQDDRFKLIRANQTKRLAGVHNASINEKTLADIKKAVSENGLDSVFYAQWTVAPLGDQTLFTIDGKSIPASDMLKAMKNVNQKIPAAAMIILDNNIDSFYNSSLVEAEEARLAVEEDDYRNLLREYEDGSLLYEVSLRKVWDRASKDKEGLKNFFESHKSDYKWSEPHAKGFLVQTVNDSVAMLIKARAGELGRDTLVTTLRKEFPKQIQIEKVLVTKGANPLVDNIAFGGPRVEPSSANFKTYFMLDERVINEPEEYTDVRGQVTSDYQNEFQRDWEADLVKKYPVKVNKKVLKSVKRRE